MCGIGGVIAWDEKHRVSRATLERISARIAHRGPDGEGTWVNHERAITRARPQAALVHRRLAVIDPDPRANQPFTDGRRHLVFNGEIYNFRDLRRDLSRQCPGYKWKTECDTEVVLLAYNAWSTKCVERFNGMFAFAIWDDEDNTLFLARDRMGQKPLYTLTVTNNDGRATLAFASEYHALTTIPKWERKISEAALRDYLRLGYIPAPRTIDESIHKIPPATWVRYRPDQPVETETYFDPNVTVECEDDPIVRTRESVTRAVARQLVSDVPLGCFLSGGTDSSIIAAAMKASVEPDQAVLTFSIGFDDPRYDETQFATQVAKHLNTEHRSFVIRPDAAADLPALATAYGEPFADSSALPTFYLARETRKHVKVALSGDGGDELFGGYDRYRAMKLSQKLQAAPRPVRGLMRAATHLPSSSHPKSFLSRLRRFATTLEGSPAVRYGRIMRLFDDELLEQLLGRDVPKRTVVEINFDRMLETGDIVEAALATDRVTYLPDDLLTKVDRASMLHALEVRSPFMDHELVQFAAGFSSEQLLEGGPKRMLRDAFAQDLPPFVFKRRKMGFAVPIGDWFRGKLRPMLADHLFAADSFARGHFNIRIVRKLIDEHERRIEDHSQRLYALLMLELWWKLHRSA